MRMNVVANPEVCSRVKCEHLEASCESCEILLNKCEHGLLYVHSGCVVPEECPYKNLHIIDKLGDKSGMGDFMGCGNCEYRPKEFK